ncbi:MAG: hypothetical protein ABJL99_20625 [Aliishimia sp.]
MIYNFGASAVALRLNVDQELVTMSGRFYGYGKTNDASPKFTKSSSKAVPAVFQNAMRTRHSVKMGAQI